MWRYGFVVLWIGLFVSVASEAVAEAVAPTTEHSDFQTCGTVMPVDGQTLQIVTEDGDAYLLQAMSQTLEDTFATLLVAGEPVAPACVWSSQGAVEITSGFVIFVERYESGRGVTISNQ